MAQSTKVNKIREVTTPAGVVLTGNMLIGKKTTNLILNDINERNSSRRYEGGVSSGNAGVNQGSDYLGFKGYQDNGYRAGYVDMYINGVYSGTGVTIYFNSGGSLQLGCTYMCRLPI